jgi:hypothetical protein
LNLDPSDVVPLVAVVMGISVILVPVIGFTARYVLKPFQDALVQYVQGRGSDDSVRILERRMALMEQQIEGMESTLDRIADAADFHRELRTPRGAPAALSAPPNDARP